MARCSKKQKKRLSVFEIIKKRGIKLNPKDNSDNNQIDESKKVKFDLYTLKKQGKINKKNEKENKEIKHNDEGVKYILFESKNSLKKLYKKKKWKLSKNNEISIFIKAVKPKEDNSKENIGKVFINEDQNIDNEIDIENPKDKATLDKLYKRKGVNQKLVKGTLKKDNYISDSGNNSDSNSSNINETIHNNRSTNKIDNNNYRGIENSDKKLTGEFINNSYENERYNTEISRPLNTNSSEERERNKSVKRNDSIDEYIDKNYKRKERKGYTARLRRIKDLEDLYEENTKTVGKVKSKKAKIKKFKSHRDDFDTDTYKPRGYLYYYIHDRKNQFNSNENSKNKKKSKSIRHFHKMKTKDIRGNSKIHRKKHYLNYENEDDYSFYKKSYTRGYGSKSNSINLSANKNQNKEKTIKSGKENHRIKNQKKHNTQIYKIGKTSKNQNTNTINYPISNILRKRRIISDNNENKTYHSKLNKTQNKLSKNLTLDNYDKRKNNNSAIKKRALKEKELKIFREMLGVDAVKSKFKKRLIEINDDLLGAIHYYNGPIDISCISRKKYAETIEELSKKVLKNGFKCIKSEANYFKFSNGLDSFLVEIVKIRNNMLYYLVVKNQ